MTLKTFVTVCVTPETMMKRLVTSLQNWNIDFVIKSRQRKRAYSNASERMGFWNILTRKTKQYLQNVIQQKRRKKWEAETKMRMKLKLKLKLKTSQLGDNERGCNFTTSVLNRTDKQTNTQTHKQTDRQTDKQTNFTICGKFFYCTLSLIIYDDLSLK